MMRSFPFTARVYFSLFEAYNDTIWPAQIVAYLLGLLVVFLAQRPMPAGGRIALAMLAAVLAVERDRLPPRVLPADQLRRGAALPRCSRCRVCCWPAAPSRGRRQLRFGADPTGWVGLAFALFALVAYPLLAWLAGHGWPRAAMFGVAATPMTIFTFGVLLMLEGRAAVLLAIIPLLWALAAGARPSSGSARPRTGRCCSPASSASPCWSGSAGSLRPDRGANRVDVSPQSAGMRSPRAFELQVPGCGAAQS